MIGVVAFTSSRNDPSSRFRMRQFFEPLRRLGIDTVEFRPWISKYAEGPWQLSGLGFLSRVLALPAARQHDIAWLNREFITGHESIERFAGKRRLLDVDDAIWLKGRNGFARRIASHCQGVIAGNECIAEHFRGSTPRIWTIPTAVDTNRWTPAQTRHESFTIGWSGTGWNLPYLHAVEEPLTRFLSDHQQAKLLVVSDRRPSFQSLEASRFEFQPWSAETEVDALRRMDVGIMPLPNDEWTRAKCAMKMLCYMAVGLPVVVSPVGAANEVLARGPSGIAAAVEDDWYDVLAALYRDRDRCAAMGRAGRGVVEQHYSVDKIVIRLAEIFREVAAL